MQIGPQTMSYKERQTVQGLLLSPIQSYQRNQITDSQAKIADQFLHVGAAHHLPKFNQIIAPDEWAERNLKIRK